MRYFPPKEMGHPNPAEGQIGFIIWKGKVYYEECIYAIIKKPRFKGV